MSDQSTIRAVHEGVRNALTDALVEDPPTEARPFRRLIPGLVDDATLPRPFLGLALTRTQTVGAVDDDRMVEVTFVIRVVTDVMRDDAHGALLAAAARVEDVLDTWREGGWVEGAEGFDVRTWVYSTGRSLAGARVVTAEGTLSCVVRVAREANG